MERLLHEIQDYWGGRAESYSDYNKEEMADGRKRRWSMLLKTKIMANFSDRKPEEIRILDVGTGPGFFARILAEQGFSVTAVDFSPEMLKNAKENAGPYVDQITWKEEDAQDLSFSDYQFDVLITRNLTWNLAYPEKAYHEWFRVLDDGGLLLNFDANWYSYLYDADKKAAYEADRRNSAEQQIQDLNVGDNFDVMEKLAEHMPLSRMNRPSWDQEVMDHCGFVHVAVDTDIWEYLWSPDEKISFASTPMFMVTGIKEKRKERILKYWTARSSSFMEQRRQELKAPITDRWMQEILPQLPKGEHLNILDVGCGAGYFSILLARLGHQVTGIDLTPDMIENARILAEEFGAKCRFLVMDAENPDFPKESFDVIITRNLTWTLPHPDQAYASWMNLLKKDGILLNFDGDYGKDYSDEEEKLPNNHSHRMLGDDMMKENVEITRRMTASRRSRPAYDVELLTGLNVSEIQLDLNVSDRIYPVIDEFYNPTRLFKLAAKKS